jgi:hypothetical protein
MRDPFRAALNVAVTLMSASRQTRRLFDQNIGGRDPQQAGNVAISRFPKNPLHSALGGGT